MSIISSPNGLYWWECMCEKHCGNSQYDWTAYCLLHFPEDFGVCAQSHTFSRYFYIFSVLWLEVNEGWHVYSKKVAYQVFGKSLVLSVGLESECFSWTGPLANQVMWISVLFCCLVVFFLSASHIHLFCSRHPESYNLYFSVHII